MTNRREFLQVSIATPAMGLISKTSIAAHSFSDAGDVLPAYYRIIHDKRVGQSVTFATYLAGRGLETHGLEKGDITPFWYRELDPVWKQSPAPLMGMTGRGPLFCLEQLAVQHGMRVVFRAEHHIGASVIRHEMRGPESLLAACRQQELLQSGHWPAAMAELMLSCPTGNIALESATLETAAPHPRTQETQNNPFGPLVSWIIAPASIRRQA